VPNRRLWLALPLCAFTVLSALSTPVSAQPAGSPDELLARCKQAYASRDARAYRALVLLTREADGPGVEAEFKRVSQQPIRSAKLLPLSAYQASYDRAIQRGMKLPMQAEGWIEIEFEPVTSANGVVEKNTAVMIFGRKDGKYYLGS
jgi:hypothetical protein